MLSKIEEQAQHKSKASKRRRWYYHLIVVMMSSSFEPPPLLLGEMEDDVFTPEEFFEEAIAAAVADAATDASPKKKKQQRRKKSTPAAASNRKRKGQQQSSIEDDASSPSKSRKKLRPPKKCSVTWCTNQSQNGKVCIRHGAQWSKKQCHKEGCINQAINSEVCRRHGATIKQCNINGCSSRALLGGVCKRHGAKIKRCSYDGGRCLNEAKSWGLCSRHGGLVGLCCYTGCINETYWGLCPLHGGPGKDFCCLDGCSSCLGDGGEDDSGEEVKLCLHRGCIEQADIGGVCDRHSDEAYLLCQPCDRNKVISEGGGGGEKVSYEETKKMDDQLTALKASLQLFPIESSTEPQVRKDGAKHASNGEGNKVAKEAHMSRGRKERTEHNSAEEGEEQVCSGTVLDGKSCILHNGVCITHSKRGEINSAVKQTLPNNDVNLASKKPRPPKEPRPLNRRIMAVIGSSSSSNKAMASLLEASGRGEVIVDNINNTRASGRISNGDTRDVDHTKTLEADSNCGGKDGKHCVQEGCFRHVVGEGEIYCKKHLDTKKTCNHDGFTEVVPNSSTFSKQRPKKPRPVILICNNEGCSNKALKSGFCSSHKPKIIHKRCSHEGCKRFAKGKGVCITHGASNQRKLCSVDGCKNQAKRRRVCKKHGAYDDALLQSTTRVDTSSNQTIR